MSKNITVKPGDDISWSGRISQNGVTSFVGYTLAAQIRPQDKSSGAAGDATSATIAWLDEAAGTFTLSVPRASTADWPVGQTMLLDIRVTTPDGVSTRTQTASFQTEAGITD